ncbi:MAG TPA: hypothetical protein PLK12_06370 [Prolixibacteraceae bacterium]|nr:hypothetical protein [Prolixibacteraceae bacterium]
MLDNAAYYEERIRRFNSELSLLSRRLGWISLFRLLGFALAFVVPFFFYRSHPVAAIGTSAFFLIVFLVLVRQFLLSKRRKQLVANLLRINLDEQKALAHDFSVFRPGNSFIDHGHPYSYDLDLFGQGSLFQYLNRTVTRKGEEQLAQMLMNPPVVSSIIRKRQEIIKELAGNPDWRQEFQARGMLCAEHLTDEDLFEQWKEETFLLKSFRFVPVLRILLSLFALFSTGFWAVAGNVSLFLLSGCIQSIYWLVEKKNTQTVYAQFGKKEKILSNLSELLGMIESFPWQSDEGKQIVRAFAETGNPSSDIRALQKRVGAFDQRNNVFVGFFGNLMFLWDIVCSYRLIQWHEKHKEAYTLWSKTYGFVDALCSLANYSYNQSHFSLPQFNDNIVHFSAKELAHPLIHPEKRVANDFAIDNRTRLIIVTGANMAGKSTFLRTLGINFLLARCGAPVCAREMTLAPLPLYTSMRTADSLFDDESYFFAELKRLKQILDEAEKNIPLFILLDEILKGTNSVDKLNGSRKLLKKMTGLQTLTVVATHDLKLTDLEDECPGVIRNYCFEIGLNDREMTFNYKIVQGVTQTMNASFMMKKMGLIDE